MGKLNNQSNHFVIITRNGTVKLSTDEILYFESEGRKVHVHTKERVISFNGSMEQVKKKLDKRFCSCHGSYAVNLTKVVRLTGYTVELEGGHIAGKPEKTCGDQISLSDLLKRKFSLQFRGRYSIVFQGLRTVRIQKNTHPGVAKPVPEKAVWEINRVEE